jgi:DNA-binding CsgD family transcriptional regulator
MFQLTPRERDIIPQICAGLSNKRIARVLGISEGTVKVHLNTIYTKLNLPNRTALAMWATTATIEIANVAQSGPKRLDLSRVTDPDAGRLTAPGDNWA